MRHRRGRTGTRQLLRPAVLTTAAVALAAVGGASAFAGWQVTVPTEEFTVYAASIPRMPPPVVSSRAIPLIAWTAVEIAPGVAVQRYVVSRHVGPSAQVVCDVPAVRVLRCVDTHAPAGYPIVYTVAAGWGRYWRGPDSAPSAAITMPGIAVPLVVDSGPPSARVSPPSASSKSSPSATPAVSVAVREPESVTLSPATVDASRSQSSSGPPVATATAGSSAPPTPLISLGSSLSLG